ncbi:unnamed protein product, partial [Anisakis simplex]|uniref:BHLH domain-containing protein n=1 Tax=Anisakis simplex TaxID=6269 RepID=A0A0M3J6D1_ANISI
MAPSNETNFEIFQDDSSSPKSLSPQMDGDRRAHHNELERRRRDHIKDHFMSLKDAIPLLDGEKVTTNSFLHLRCYLNSIAQSRSFIQIDHY